MTSSNEQSRASAKGVRRGGRLGLWLMRLALAGLSFGLMVGLAELCLWVFAPVPYHEWMIWIPDGHIKGRAEPYQVFHTAAGSPVRINKFGFRGPDYDWRPAPGTLRLIVLGGSSTFCYHAHGEENTWPSRLEAHLREGLGMPVEVVNLGLPGFETSNSKINYLFLGRALNPHVALIYHTWNDIKLFRGVARQPLVFVNTVRNNPLWQRVARETQIGRYARNFWYAQKLLKMETYFSSLEESDAEAARPVPEFVFDWARRNFVDFARFASGDGVLPVLVTQATLDKPENLARPQYRKMMGMHMVGMTAPVLVETWARMSRIIEDVAHEHGAVVVDGYNAVPSNFEHLEDHVHLLDRGSDVLARAIAETLMRDERFQAVIARVRAQATTWPAEAAGVDAGGERGRS